MADLNGQLASRDAAILQLHMDLASTNGTQFRASSGEVQESEQSAFTTSEPVDIADDVEAEWDSKLAAQAARHEAELVSLRRAEYRLWR